MFIGRFGGWFLSFLFFLLIILIGVSSAAEEQTDTDPADELTGAEFPPDETGWLSHLDGLYVNVGYSSSFLLANIEGPFEAKTYGNHLATLEAWYTKPLLRIAETFGLFHRPYFSLQTDFGLTTASDLAAISEPSNIFPAANLKLLAQINPIEWIFVRYRGEVFVSEVTGKNDFIYTDYHGNSTNFEAGDPVYMVNEFHDYEIGVVGSPYGEKNSFIEVGYYQSTWERPRVVDYRPDLFEEQVYYQVYHGIQDFRGIHFGAMGMIMRKDQDGEEREAARLGYYLRSGSGKLRLSQHLEEKPDDNTKTAFGSWEFGTYFRYYLPLTPVLDLGLGFHYNFKRASTSSNDWDSISLKDQTFVLSTMVQFVP